MRISIDNSGFSLCFSGIAFDVLVESPSDGDKAVQRLFTCLFVAKLYKLIYGINVSSFNFENIGDIECLNVRLLGTVLLEHMLLLTSSGSVS